MSPGGSGGGSWGGGGQGPTTFGSATQPGTNSLYGATDYGNAGGKRPWGRFLYCGSGGGGAGGAGGDAGNPASTGGTGGNGRASTIAYGPANPVSYAGGGGGGNTPYGGNNAVEPGGGGAAGSRGEHATGGGGGGALAGASTPNSGGSGIAVIRYQIATISTAKATGGAVSFAGGKTIHTFVNSGTFTVTSGPISADYLVIGGGGGGGTFDAGGGGAGALKYATGQTIADGPYSVTVGGGGSTGQLYPGSNSPGTQSQLALPSAVTSPGGGGGAPYQTDGGAGGSGGGGGGNPGRSVAAGSGDSGHPGGIDHRQCWRIAFKWLG